MDAIKTRIYLIKVHFHLSELRVYMIYDRFFPFLSKYLTDIL